MLKSFFFRTILFLVAVGVGIHALLSYWEQRQQNAIYSYTESIYPRLTPLPFERGTPLTDDDKRDALATSSLDNRIMATAVLAAGEDDERFFARYREFKMGGYSMPSEDLKVRRLNRKLESQIESYRDEYAQRSSKFLTGNVAIKLGSYSLEMQAFTVNVVDLEDKQNVPFAPGIFATFPGTRWG